MSVYDRQTRPAEGQPHCWIQWKGTDVCMDFHCECGYMAHVDAAFAYHVRCPKCGVVYFCNGHIELVKLTIAEVMDAVAIVDVPNEDTFCDEEGE